MVKIVIEISSRSQSRGTLFTHVGCEPSATDPAVKGPRREEFGYLVPSHTEEDPGVLPAPLRVGGWRAGKLDDVVLGWVSWAGLESLYYFVKYWHLP